MRFEKTWKGVSSRDESKNLLTWDADPDLAAAGVVMAFADRLAVTEEVVPLALTALLRRDPRFELVYEDEVAVVFVRKK